MKHKKPVEIKTQESCKYGCGNIAKWATASGHLICESHPSKCEVNKSKNSLNVKKSYDLGQRLDMKTVYRNLPEETKISMNWNKGNYNADFSYGGKGSHKQVLIKELGHKCQECKLSEWNGVEIPLELEHKDGDNCNNNKDNLLLLCPNCHALTSTWRGRNINSSKVVSDNELVYAISVSKNIRQALIFVGLTPKGANYVRCNNLIHEGLAKLANASGLSSDDF